MTAAVDPRDNHLIAALPDAVWQRWAPLLQPVELSQGQVLYEAGDTVACVYFPITAVISVSCVTEDGESAEIVGVGNEGVIGVSLFMGGDSTVSRAVVQIAGHAFRLKARAVMDEFDRGGAVVRLLLRYTQSMITQIAQLAVCNRHHSLEQRLCRWLLINMVRAQSDEIDVTQEAMAQLLGVRREGVTQAAFRLQQAGLIRYARGHVTALDRPGLQRHSCECYRVAKREYDRLRVDKLAA